MPNQYSRWFEPETYFNNYKTLNNFTNEQAVAALNAAGYQISGITNADLDAAGGVLEAHFREVGNALNISPNLLFNVQEYREAKMADLEQKRLDSNPNNDTQLPAGYTSWTEQAVDKAMELAGLSYWDHYLAHGMSEGLNPSKQFDTIKYLDAKMDQLNAVPVGQRQPLPEGFTGNEWTRPAVIKAFQIANLNAVQHYESYAAPDVPESEREDIDYRAGTVIPGDLVTKNLEAGPGSYTDDGVATDFVATVAPVGSTLDPGTSITGSGNDDKLTVNMTDDWSGFEQTGEGGGMTGVSTVVLNNEAVDTPLNFNAQNITGVTTYQVNGNVNLDNVAFTNGLAVNLKGVTPDAGAYQLAFTEDSVAGESDSLNLGVTDMPEEVTVETTGIESVTINSTGDTANKISLQQMEGLETVKVTGSADTQVALGEGVTTVDATSSQGDVTVDATSANLQSIKTGSGDDNITLGAEVAPNATIAGGSGQDVVTLDGTSSAYQFVMTGVETLNVGASEGSVTSEFILDGSKVKGLQNLGLNGGNGAEGADRQIALVNYKANSLGVDVTGENNADVTIDSIRNVTLNVGDGDADTTDSLNGEVNLLDATKVAVNVNDSASAAFNAQLNAANATNLTLANTQASTLSITGGDLAKVNRLTVSGTGDVTATGAQIGADASRLNVDAKNLVGGAFTAEFAASEDGGILNFTGSTTGKSNVTVGQNYNNVTINTGVADDSLYLAYKESDPTSLFTSSNLTGNLGYGNNTVYVSGRVTAGVLDFTGLDGIDTIKFTGMTEDMVKTLVGNKQILADADVVITGTAGTPDSPGGGTVENPTFTPGTGDEPVTLPSTIGAGETVVLEPNANTEGKTTIQGIPNQTNAYAGTIANDTTITGNNPAGAAGVQVDFGSDANQLKVDSSVNEARFEGGTGQTNSFTGTLNQTDSAQNTTIVTGSANDTVDMTLNQAAGQTTKIDNAGNATGDKFAVNVGGAGDAVITSASTAGVTVGATATGTTTLNSTGANGSDIDVNVAEGNTGAEVVVKTSAATGVTKQNVVLDVQGGKSVTVDSQAGQSIQVTGTMAAPDLTLNSATGSNFNVDGSDMGQLTTLTTTGGGTTTVNGLVTAEDSLTLNTGGDTTLTNTNANTVQSLTINATAASKDDVTVSGTVSTPEGQAPKILGFSNVTEVTVETGSTDVTLNAQLGTNETSNLDIEVTGTGGFTLGGAGIATKNATFTGGDGVDRLVVDPAATSGGEYTIDMGKGDDQIRVQAGHGGTAGTYTTVNLTLGEGNDTVWLYSDAANASANRAGGIKLCITEWETGDTMKALTIGGQASGGAAVAWGTKSGSSFTAADNAVQFLGQFGVNVNADDITEDATIGDNNKILVVGGHSYIAYLPSLNGSDSASSFKDGDDTVDVDGAILIDITGSLTATTGIEIVTA